jgi:hypothetical protein
MYQNIHGSDECTIRLTETIQDRPRPIWTWTVWPTLYQYKHRCQTVTIQGRPHVIIWTRTVWPTLYNTYINAVQHIHWEVGNKYIHGSDECTIHLTETIQDRPRQTMSTVQTQTSDCNYTRQNTCNMYQNSLTNAVQHIHQEVGNNIYIDQNECKIHLTETIQDRPRVIRTITVWPKLYNTDTGRRNHRTCSIQDRLPQKWQMVGRKKYIHGSNEYKIHLTATIQDGCWFIWLV